MPHGPVGVEVDKTLALLRYTWIGCECCGRQYTQSCLASGRSRCCNARRMPGSVSGRSGPPLLPGPGRSATRCLPLARPRSRILALAGWVEAHGVEGLLELVRRHALHTVRSAYDDSIPEADEVLLEELAKAMPAGDRPLPSELLGRARQRDEVTFKGWHPKSGTHRLKNYGLDKPKRAGGERRYKNVPLSKFREIQERYGIDPGIPAEAGGGGPTPTAPSVVG